MKVVFEVYIFSRIFKKRENMYSAKISTFTVVRFSDFWGIISDFSLSLTYIPAIAVNLTCLVLCSN